ncbi:hypothetical protein TUMEXPCC7403_10570 [Tumidithrix helvetica PCC 7403]
MQGKVNEAEPLFLRALKKLMQTLGQDHPNTRKVRENYESCLKVSKSISTPTPSNVPYAEIVRYPKSNRRKIVTIPSQLVRFLFL